MSSVPSSTPFRSHPALVPHGWSSFEGLLCGFGDRFAAAPPSTLLLLRQVHGDRIVSADAALASGPTANDGYRRLAEEADAIVVDRAGSVAGIRTADCVPALLVAPRQGWAAAVHAGWRGTLAGIVAGAVARAVAAGIPAHELHAALGPSIGPCCYEVSASLAQEFAAAGHEVLEGAPGSQPRLDLRSINSRLLESAGVLPDRIQSCGPCTRCAAERFHSFRAQPDSDGRQVSWIGWEGRMRPPDR